MEGGHLLGQGSYGCVFTPPLLCKSHKVQKFKRVGKITEMDDAEHEIQIANHLRKMPFVKHYILLPDPESCEPAPLSQQKDKEIRQCEATSRENSYQVPWSESRQLFLPFGGRKPLGNMILASNIHPSSFSFLDFMKHILEAGSLLLVAGICHYDLHPNNFLQDPYGVVRILDLGQAFDARTITEETVKTRWKQLMFGFEEDAPNSMVTNAEAPEITIINAMRNQFEQDEAIQNVIQGKTVFRDMERVLGISRETCFHKLQKFFETSQSIKQRDWVQFYKLYWTGFDAWSIGSLLLKILQYQISWTEFLQEPEWQKNQTTVKLALQGLLNPNPHKRLDCVEALFLMDPSNKWIQQFGKAWLEKRQRIRASQQKN
jgi:serine/threonine protein kinase